MVKVPEFCAVLCSVQLADIYFLLLLFLLLFVLLLFRNESFSFKISIVLFMCFFVLLLCSAFVVNKRDYWRDRTNVAIDR